MHSGRSPAGGSSLAKRRN